MDAILEKKEVDDKQKMKKMEKKLKKGKRKERDDHHHHSNNNSNDGDGDNQHKRRKKDKKDKKKKKKKKDKEKKESNKKREIDTENDNNDNSNNGNEDKESENNEVINNNNKDDDENKDDKIVSSSALQYAAAAAAAATASTTSSVKTDKKTDKDKNEGNNVTLLLFYQYVEPPWDNATFTKALSFVQQTGNQYNLTGRMRVAKEGLNCTLTGTYDNVRSWCASLRQFHNKEFANTEFKLTDHLPQGQLFPQLKAFEVDELVHYGLAGKKAPPISKTGTHLEPQEYHAKMAEPDTVIIDVRNHYESIIGHFTPPSNGAQLIDPKMRKSTEFPPWLDKPSTRQLMKDKQVLMYCTGGVRCERASALLREKMETDEEISKLNIKGVYQLQGGIDKYFKEFPEGGYWRGKNYTFDKRFAHAPPLVESQERFGFAGAGKTLDIKEDEKQKNDDNDDDKKKIKKSFEGKNNDNEESNNKIMGKCEACSKPWDMYRGKRRCPTCGVPSLICKSCFQKDKKGIIKLGKNVKCTLCREENITSKKQVREREMMEIQEYERRMNKKKKKNKQKLKKDGDERQDSECSDNDNDDDNTKETSKKKKKRDNHNNQATTTKNNNKPKVIIQNPENITRLFLKNLCAKKTTQSTLLQTFASINTKITHIQWLTDRKSGKFYGSAFVEMATAKDATAAVNELNGSRVFGRNMIVKFQKADGKDIWPPPKCAVVTEE